MTSYLKFKIEFEINPYKICMVNNVLNIDSKQFKISWNVDEFIILSVYQKVVENVNRDKTQILKEGLV